MRLLEFQADVVDFIFIALVVVKMWALVDAVLRPGEAYLATDKMTKPGWLWILGLALAIDLVPLRFFLLNLLGVVAAFVYLLDVRPALREVTRRR